MNRGNKTTDIIVVRVQHLIDQWQYALQLTSRELKQSKYYWILQSYSWKNGRCILDKTIQYQITI